MKKKVRRTFLIHHWCGLIAGILILTISLSGILLLFDDELDRRVFADNFTLDAPFSALKVDNSVHWIRARYSDWDIRVPALPERNDDALLYELRKGQLRKWVFVHPETGKEIALVDQAHNRLTYLALNIHYNLLAGTTGKVVVLFTGVAFLALTITGAILYRRSLWRVLTFRKKLILNDRKGFFSSLHHIVGVWALLFNLVMGVTGLSLAVTVVSAAFKGSATEVAVPALRASVDSIMAATNATYPEFRITYLRFPLNSSGTIQLLGRLSSDPACYGRFYSKVPANFATGELGTPYFIRDQPWVTRVLTAFHVVHFGDYAGLAVQVIYAFFGLMPGMLGISGFLMWWQRNKSVRASLRQSKRRPHML